MIGQSEDQIIICLDMPVFIHSQNPTQVAIRIQRFFAGHTEIDKSLGGHRDLLAGCTQRFINFYLFIHIKTD